MVVGLWAFGCRSCVWGFPAGRIMCSGLGVCRSFHRLEGGPQSKFVGDAAREIGFGDSGFHLVPLCGFSSGGLGAELVSAGLLLCSFAGVTAFWALCWWDSSIVLYCTSKTNLAKFLKVFIKSRK